MSTISIDTVPSELPFKRLLALALGSVGVVYGDIGTSPLYAFREAIKPVVGDGATPQEIIGIISLMIWTLTIIVTLKYVFFLLRADNRGEGGTLSLLALLADRLSASRARLLFLLGLIGAALFLGDAMITPALSVLSAVEGLKLVTPALTPYVLPLSVAVLLVLFAVQSRGTGTVSKAFGPITLVWFAVLALAGLPHIFDAPIILRALNPIEALIFFVYSGYAGFVVLGAVFLTVTGAEALYADLGHFGRKPIQYAWLGVVYPALMLNYLGQGALVMSNPATIENPFYLMFPEWALIPAIILATAATIIASQAVITGAFSLVSQAIHLGFLPRLEINHTSASDTGQIYLPAVNGVLLFGVMLLVLIFQSSDALATAYGISVTGAMVVTTLMFYYFLRLGWNWSLPAALSLIVPLAAFEAVFLAANLLKIHDGGYVPVMIAAGAVIIMWTWRKGSSALTEKARQRAIPLKDFIATLEASSHAPVDVSGTAIFLTADPMVVPGAMLHNIKHNHVLHERNIVLSIRTENRPSVPPEERFEIERLTDRFTVVTLFFGFMDTPNVSQALGQLRRENLKFDIMTTSFYLGHRKLVQSDRSAMPAWQDKLFISLAGAAADPSDYFKLPSNRVVELGTHVAV